MSLQVYSIHTKYVCILYVRYCYAPSSRSLQRVLMENLNFATYPLDGMGDFSLFALLLCVNWIMRSLYLPTNTLDNDRAIRRIGEKSLQNGLSF
jgi:hypothetical protein